MKKAQSILASLMEKTHGIFGASGQTQGEPRQTPDQAIARWLGITPEQAAGLDGWPTRRVKDWTRTDHVAA